jgi:hypothetical protein
MLVGRGEELPFFPGMDAVPQRGEGLKRHHYS